MKRIRLFLCSVVLIFVGFSSFSQTITYSVVHNESARNTNFEILGKVGPNYLVFKSIDWRHIMQVFDANMKELSNERLKFTPDKMTNADFVVYKDYVLMVYQYRRGSIVYCNAVKLDAFGQQLGEVINLDTTRTRFQSDGNIYSTVASENKEKILVYKMHEKNDDLNVVTKLYDKDLRLLDSTRSLIPFNDRREVYSPFQLANDGTIFLTRETKTGNREYISLLEVITNKPYSNTFKATAIDLQKKFIDGSQIKIDNMNNNLIVNSFYYPEKRGGSIEGIFSAIMNKETGAANAKFNAFGDSLRVKVNSSGSYRFAFDNMFLKDIFVKRDGSYVLVAEDFTSQNLGSNNPWNRWDYMYGNPYSVYNDYYYWNSPYYRYNRYNSFGNNRSVRYDYDNVMVISMDSSLVPQWETVILKKQSDDDDDSYLSYGTMNAGSEIHFLYIEKERNTQIISNQSVSPYGKLYRYPTLKSREAGYQFMPRLSKQVGVQKMIMPCVYRGNICFASIDF